MIELVRVFRKDIKETMFIRPRDPDNHEEFEWLLPQCTPLFYYLDGGGRAWVRWALPKAIATEIGWGAMKCACCDGGGAVESPNADDFHVDTAFDEVSWYLERL